MSIRKPTESRPDDALDEVERALSVLGGRHPETERLRREEAEARAKKQVELAALAAEDRKVELRRRVGISAGAVVGVVAVVALGVFVKTSLARRAVVERAVEPYRTMGFELVATSSRASPRSVEGTVAPGCVLAIASEPSAQLEVRRPSGTIKGPGPILFCICDSESVAASADLGESGGVALLRMDAAQVGGSRALPFAPGKAATTAKTDDACAEASFDAWLEAKRFPKAAPDDAWFAADPARKGLAAAGFTSALALGAEPFAAIEVPKGSCVVALPDAPGDPVTLRARGVGVVGGPEGGALGWCAEAETVVTVHHEGRGRVGAMIAPAARIGGLRGVREIGAAAGVRFASLSVQPADRGWDASMTLAASAVPEVTAATAPDVPRAPEARVVALSFGAPNALSAESEAEVFSYCEPALDASTLESVCVFSGRHQWSLASAEKVGGLARAKLPYWLSTFAGVGDPVALKGEVELLALARRLRREGFEPSVIEGITETPTGAQILGRSNEDAVVAVATQTSAPWVLPLSDGPPWTLGEAPRIVRLAPLEKVALAAPRGLAPATGKARRTVVFRRATR